MVLQARKRFSLDQWSGGFRTVILLAALAVIFVICNTSFETPARRLSDEEEGLESTVVLLFMFFGLAVGIIAMQVLSFFGEAIPYTCLVFLLGAIFSVGNNTHDGTFGKSIAQWVNIDADLLLFVFLPPLIFGEAMSLNWYHVKGGIFQSIVLAGPGVLIGAALMGVFTKYLLPYNWSWTLSMVFGSILSATDPVAVVALLKSVGASPKLTILIVGESLLNDGSAMVLFTLFFNSLNGTVYNAGSIIAFFFEAAIGSVLLGIAFGLVTVRWLRSANRPLKEIDVTTQIAITICCAYLCFFTAQYTLKISGVLACCGAGAMLAWLAPPIILNHESMHNVWSMIEWSLNTLIFLLAGLIIGNRVLSKVYAMDWLYLLVLYALLMVIRVIVIAMLYPIISTTGHRCTFQEAVFMSWAGLRGALGMALALLVEKHCPDREKDETSRLFFFVGGIAALTLIINASTAKSLLFHLGLLSTNSAEKKLVTDQIKKKLRRKMDKVIEQMTKDFKFTADDLDVVRQSCTLLQHVDMDALYRDTERASTLLANISHDPHLYLQDQLSPHDASLQHTRRGSHNQTVQHQASSNNRRGSEPNLLAHQQGSNNLRHNSRAVSTSTRQRRNSSFAATFANGLVGHGKDGSRYQDSDRIDRISRLLSRGGGGRSSSSLIDRDLLHYIRAVFLEIVRVKYWHFIEVGKLPRLSHSAQFLLYSIEVGLDEVSQVDGARDWACLEEDLDYKAFAVMFFTLCENYLPLFMTGLATALLGRLEARREKRAVYMLTSFIEAHEHAQKKIHAFLGLEEEEIEAATPEEMKVIEESKAVVEKAKARLQNMNHETVGAIRSKQAARLVLAKEAEMVRNMVQEGLLTPHHAEEFLEEISHDTQRIEQERNRMYREHADRKGQIRWQEKQVEFDEQLANGGSARPSLFFNPFTSFVSQRSSNGAVVTTTNSSGIEEDLRLSSFVGNVHMHPEEEDAGLRDPLLDSASASAPLLPPHTHTRPIAQPPAFPAVPPRSAAGAIFESVGQHTSAHNNLNNDDDDDDNVEDEDDDIF